MNARTPQFYVINSSGQYGPYDLDGLREALRAGEIGAEDRVRSGMGTPLGTVLRVLEIKSRPATRPAHRHSSDRFAPSPIRASWHTAAIVGTVGCLVCGALWLLMRGGGSSPVPASESAMRVEAPPETRPSESQPPPKPPPSVQPATVAKSSPAPTSSSQPADAALIASVLGLRLFDDQGLEQVYRGQGAEVVIGPGPVWQLDYPGGGGTWIGLTPKGYAWDIRQAAGLTLILSGTQSPVRLKLMLYESDNEAFSAFVDLPPGTSATSYELPWTHFTRDELQKPNAPADGFQGKEVRYVSLINVAGAVRGVRLHGLSSLVRHESATVPVGPSPTPAAAPTATQPAPAPQRQPQAPEALQVGDMLALVSARPAGAWLVGDGASIADTPEKSWSVSFPVPGTGWVGIAPDASSEANGASTGVELDVTAGAGACDLFVQLIESDGESFVAPISVGDGSGRRLYTVRWKEFTRDPKQKPGAANDGFAHAGLSYFALTVRSGATQGLLLHRIGLLPGEGH